MPARPLGTRSPPPLPPVRGHQPRLVAHERRPVGRALVVPPQRRRLPMLVAARQPRTPFRRKICIAQHLPREPLKFAGGGDVVPRVVRLLVPEGADEYQSAGVDVGRPEPVVEGGEICEPGTLVLPNISPGKLLQKTLNAHGRLEKKDGRKGCWWLRIDGERRRVNNDENILDVKDTVFVIAVQIASSRQKRLKRKPQYFSCTRVTIGMVWGT